MHICLWGDLFFALVSVPVCSIKIVVRMFSKNKIKLRGTVFFLLNDISSCPACSREIPMGVLIASACHVWSMNNFVST